MPNNSVQLSLEGKPTTPSFETTLRHNSHWNFIPAEDALKLSDDVIEDAFTSTPDSRIWDLSPMRFGAAKTARESVKSPDDPSDNLSSFLFLSQLCEQ
jgi:hypothetical protein